MKLGERIRKARLEAGLSQRELCAEKITRNMLSLIENGGAKPSMETLGYLAEKLGKPVGYFLGEDSGSGNTALIMKLRASSAEDILEGLKSYRAPDEIFDAERYFLEAAACMELAQKAFSQGKTAYCYALLEQAARAGEKTHFYTPETERKRLLLCYSLKKEKAEELKERLPDWEEEVFLRAEAALQEDVETAVSLLRLLPKSTKQQYLLGEGYGAMKDYEEAAVCYENAIGYCATVYARLEQCYREQKNYEKAYFYACKQRQGEGKPE